jgi:ABC-type multidrug transport system ATPase subunit
VALRVDALSKRYGAIEAVGGVSFDVREGEIFGLLGLNGAGKTTLISMLATERRPSAGDALLFGHSVREERPAVRRMIGRRSPGRWTHGRYDPKAAFARPGGIRSNWIYPDAR